MPEDIIWLLQRRAEHAAFTKLPETLHSKPGHAVQSAGLRCCLHRPVPISLDLDRHRRSRP